MKMALREAYQNFSKAIRAVKSGRVVILTERGKPIAAIQPIAVASSEEDAVRELIKEGLIQPAKQPGVIRDSWKPLHVRGALLSKAVRELRNEE